MGFYEEDDSLPGCVADAAAVANLLRRDASNEVNFVDVIDLISTDARPVTAELLLGEFASLFDETDPDDSVLFYYSGHAKRTVFGLYLVTSEKAGAYDVGVPFDCMMHLVNEARHGSVTLILDCCFAGAAGDLPKLDGQVVSRSLLREDVTILASSRASQLSFVEETGEMSDYTRLLVRGLEGEASSDAVSVTALDLHRFVVANWAGELHQVPVLKANGSGGHPLRRLR